MSAAAALADEMDALAERIETCRGAAAADAKPPSAKKLIRVLQEGSAVARTVCALQRQLHYEKTRSSTEKHILWDEMRADLIEREAHATVVARRFAESCQRGERPPPVYERVDAQVRRMRDQDAKGLGGAMPCATEQATIVALAREAELGKDAFE